MDMRGRVFAGTSAPARPIDSIYVNSTTHIPYVSLSSSAASYRVVGGFFADTDTITFGTGLDVVGTANGTNLVWTQGAGLGSWVFGDSLPVVFGTGLDVQALPNGTNLLWTQGAGAGAFIIGDSLPLHLGTGGDVIFTPNGTNVIGSGSGELQMPDANIGWDLRRAIADPGTGAAIPVTNSGSAAFAVAGVGETNTLAIPTKRGQMLQLTCASVAAMATRIVTCAQAINAAGNTIMTFDATTDWIVLVAAEVAGALRWRVWANDGVALS